MSDAILRRASTAATQGGIGRLAPLGLWIATALLFIVLPLIFRSGTALTMLSLMGIAIIFALSYNMLLGQTGLLSFGHAVYYGLGAYFTVHAINAAIAAALPVPLIVMPLIGGLAGLGFAALFEHGQIHRELAVHAHDVGLDLGGILRPAYIPH